MYRKSGGQVFGVLNDFDVSSLLCDIKAGTAVSLRRTGTPPYMAYDLQASSSSPVTPLYRHDLESLFYVFCALLVRHEFMRGTGTSGVSVQDAAVVRICRRDNPGLMTWFDLKLSPSHVASEKAHMFYASTKLQLDQFVSPDFQALAPCLLAVHRMFIHGFFEREAYGHAALMLAEKEEEDTRLPFNDEELGGEVTYVNFENALRKISPKPLIRFVNPL